MNKKPLLIDLDGVLRIGKKPAPGLEKFIERINKQNIPSCIISNSTLSNSGIIEKFFIDNLIDINISIMTAADAAYNYVKEKYKSVSVYCSEPVRSMFSDITGDENPDAVVIGDMGKAWDYNILNEIFLKVIGGAEIIAMQMNRYWHTPEKGYLLDAGPFVKAIEYASGKTATLIGKPSPIYFFSALKILGYSDSDSFIMLGDDIETDIKGAAEIGAETILIYTGKTKYPFGSDAKIKPDYEAKNLADVIKILKL